MLKGCLFMCMLQGTHAMWLLTHVQVHLVRMLALVCRLALLGTAVPVQKASEAPAVRKRSRVSVLHKMECVSHYSASLFYYFYHF